MSRVKIGRRMLSLCLAAVFLFLCCPFPARALTGEGRTVKVAYPIQAGLTGFDEYGNYCGYTYEYLEEIAQYTGWDYEFVEAPGTLDESLGTLMDMVQNGELDLMGAMVYTEQTGEMFDYASQSYGTGETVLQVPYDSVQNVKINSQVQQTFRVAVSRPGTRIRQELEDYCRINLVTPVYVECEDTAAQVRAVREGRADVLLNSSMNYVEGMRIIARFSPKPFYFVTAKGSDTGLMEELNAAIMSIEQADPYFTTRLYEKYFAPPNDVLVLSEAEQAYVESAGTLRVGVLTGQQPYQYEEDGELSGIGVDLLSYIAEKTGLRFELVRAESADALDRMIAGQEIQMVAGMPYDYETARTRRLSMTQAYVSSQYILLMNEAVNENSIKGKRLALSSASTYDGIFYGVVSYYDTTEDCIRAVAAGEADYTYMDAYAVQYYVSLPEYKNLKMIPQTYEPRRVCFGVAKPGSRELLSILNKAVTTISEPDLQGIINRNTIRKPPYSLSYFVREYPLETICTLAGIFLAIIVLLLFSMRQRQRRNRQNALELKKLYQVYALVNDYFFEYDFKTGRMIVSVPSKDSKGQPELKRFDYSGEDGPHADRDRRFFQAISSGVDGVREVEVDCIDGERHWLRIAVDTVFDGEKPAYALGKINIIDEERREKDALLKKARLDSLTRLYNAETGRSLIQERLRKLEGQTGALILLDVDRFKAINDGYGHLCGDETLARVSALLQESFRADDIVGRPGGDEFIVYLNGVKDCGALASKCGSLCEKAHAVTLPDGKHITFSAGASLAVQGDSYEALYSLADEALYKAKAEGRDRFCLAERPSAAK